MLVDKAHTLFRYKGDVMAKVTVLGAGSWGTALSYRLCKNGHSVTLWAHREEQAESLRNTRENDKLPGVFLPENIRFTSHMEEAASGADLIVMAVPSTATRETMEKAKPFLPAGQRVCVVSKGIEEATLMVQTEIIEDVMPSALTAVLSGPSHAEEVIADMPTVVVAGSADRFLALFVQELFMSPVFRVYVSSDVKGIELGGSLKNVIALAAGMSDGLGFGDNAKAALITRGVSEMSGLATACGANPATLSGLTGIGDLIVTCESRHSRNRKAGMLIGQGKSMTDAMAEVKMVVEGVYSAKAALALGQKYEVPLPIIEAVNGVLFESLPARDAVSELMNRERKSEFSSVGWD